MNVRRKKHCLSRKTGQSLIELLSILVVLLPVVLVLIDMGVIALGAAVNDSICRDAVRAASSGPTGSPVPCVNRQVGAGESPKQRALAVIRRLYKSEGPMKVRDDVSVLETVRDIPLPEVGGAVDGDVTVETTIDVYPPFLVKAVVGSQISLKTSHSVPITHTVFPQTQP